ncbi:MAG: PQQ-dependent sugar dehydrogenase [Ignavibacteriales bacterium]|nr:PQQ-dependent sugar dehydrogenase [Ignavibacteriales bacterium]
MVKKFASIFILFLSLISCSHSRAQLQIEQAFPELTFQQPVDIQNSGDGSNRLFVLEQRGIISVFPNNSSVSTKAIFLDITDRVASGGEMGLLGLAFHQDYKNNGYFYVDYTTNSPSRRTIISRFKVSGDANKADKSSELVLMQIEQPYSNHNGGQITFGPDGYLYISLGDGGSGGDPQNNAQNLQSLLGKILRIDIDKTDNGKNYSIPTDNPFKGNTSGNREEIYAYGLRNVWRFSFDSLTKQLWGADVGQNAWEEIDLIEKGGNYGWRCYEGLHTYNTAQCNSNNYINPIFEYGHNSDGGFSITGGFVYRGSKVAELYGKYIYADFVSSHIWSLELKDGKVTNKKIFTNAHPVSTFGVDEANELYFANYSSGKIYRFKQTDTGGTGKAELPDKFKLYQNFPNPFNPSTNIRYQLATTGYVTLKIFDVLGNEVATLVDELQQSGVYSSSFSTIPASHAARQGGRSPLTSGIYFYQLRAGSFVSTKKLIVMK